MAKTAAERDDETIKRTHARCQALPYSTWNRVTEAEQNIWREERIAAINEAVAEERARCAAVAASHRRLLQSAKLLAAELSDPGSEALAAIACAEMIERGNATLRDATIFHPISTQAHPRMRKGNG